MPSLAGRRILLVEDEPIIALAIEDMLVEIGCEVVGPALNAQRSEELAKTERIDAAVLDVNLSGDTSRSAALILQSKRVPFCFSTGYGSGELLSGFECVPVLQKPYGLDKLAQVLAELLHDGRQDSKKPNAPTGHKGCA